MYVYMYIYVYIYIYIYMYTYIHTYHIIVRAGGDRPGRPPAGGVGPFAAAGALLEQISMIQSI